VWGSTGPQAIAANPAASIAALVCAVLAGVAIAVLARSRRGAPVVAGPASIELRAEPPAVVDLLTGGFDVDDDAVPATVVDLAARNWFSIEEYGPGNTIIRTRTARPTGQTLQPYEQMVLDHIERHAIDGTLPTQVLTTGTKTAAQRWFQRFAKAVTAHGQQLGLCEPRFGWRERAAGFALIAVGVGPALVVADRAGPADDPSDWASAGNILLGLALVAAAALVVGTLRILRAGLQRATPAGAAAAAHWLGVRDFYSGTDEFADRSAASVAIWDHHLAYATAMGLARTVQRQIPFDSEHDRHAWSRATGKWRRVEVRYRTIRPGWGVHPGWLVFTGLLAGAAWGAATYGAIRFVEFVRRPDVTEYITLTAAQERWISLGSTAAAVIALTGAVHSAVRFLLGAADLFRHRQVEGEVVRLRARGGGEDSEPTYHLALDVATPTNGADDSILAYRVRPNIYRATAQGARARLDVTPLLGYVRSITALPDQ